MPGNWLRLALFRIELIRKSAAGSRPPTGFVTLKAPTNVWLMIVLLGVTKDEISNVIFCSGSGGIATKEVAGNDSWP